MGRWPFEEWGPRSRKITQPHISRVHAWERRNGLIEAKEVNVHYPGFPWDNRANHQSGGDLTVEGLDHVAGLVVVVGGIAV